MLNIYFGTRCISIQWVSSSGVNNENINKQLWLKIPKHTNIYWRHPLTIHSPQFSLDPQGLMTCFDFSNFQHRWRSTIVLLIAKQDHYINCYSHTVYIILYFSPTSGFYLSGGFFWRKFLMASSSFSLCGSSSLGFPLLLVFLTPPLGDDGAFPGVLGDPGALDVLGFPSLL